MSNANRIRRVLAEGGATSGEVAAETGLSVRYCSAALYRMWQLGHVSRSEKRVPQYNRPSAYRYTLVRRVGMPWTEEETEELLRLAGLPVGEIAKRLNRPTGAVWQRARRMGLDLAKRELVYWPPAARSHVVELRREGLTIREIADRSPVPHGTIARWLSPRGMREWRA